MTWVGAAVPPPPAAPLRCRNCGEPIVDTDVGWTHVGSARVRFGWLCPAPHMTLADPPSAGPSVWMNPLVAGPQMPREPAGPQLPHEPRRRTTPIPPTARQSHPPRAGEGIP